MGHNFEKLSSADVSGPAGGGRPLCGIFKSKKAGIAKSIVASSRRRTRHVALKKRPVGDDEGRIGVPIYFKTDNKYASL